MRGPSTPSLLNVVLAAGGGWLLAACAYTLCLLGGAGWIETVLAVAGLVTAWLIYWLRRAGRVSGVADRRLAAVAGLTALAACALIKAHGAYDAWLHWNSLAKYMSRPEYFRMLRQPNSLWHADYPPGLPAPIGLVWRALGADPELVPRVSSFLFFLPIPLLLAATAQRSAGPRLVWLWVPALFIINFECLSQGLNQYADIPLALFLLLSLMCLDMYRGTGDDRWITACGLMLGGCLLMKNEGAVLVPAVLLGHAAQWTRAKAPFRLLAGLLLPAAALILYKRYIPAPNDVIGGLRSDPLAHVAELKRYRIIGYYLLRFSLGRFPVFVLFFAWIAWRRRKDVWRLSPALLSLVLCVAGYLLVYLTTDIGLEWLVPTSLNRLMMQLLPAGVYIALRGPWSQRSFVSNS